jgi:hypothetical protein
MPDGNRFLSVRRTMDVIPIRDTVVRESHTWLGA